MPAFSTLWDHFQASLQAQLANEFFSGGLLLGLLAGASTLLWKAWTPTLTFLRRQITASVLVHDETPVYYAVEAWVAAHSRTREVQAALRGPYEHDDDPGQVVFSPAPGNHLLWLGGRPVWLLRRRAETTGPETQRPMESLRIETLGRSRRFAARVIEEGQALLREREHDRLRVVLPGSYSTTTVYRARRSLDSLVLAEGLLDTILADVTTFLGARDRYARLGIPYRRGYLFEGPPGTGKSTLAAVLGAHFRMAIHYVSLQTQTDNTFFARLAEVPGRSIILLEDVDASFSDPREPAGALVGFNTILNGLDGIGAPEGVLVIMTTNRVHSLDPALLRPGRIDRRFHIGYATPYQVRAMAERFYGPGEDTDRLARHIAATDTCLTPADVQAFFQCHTAPYAALQAVRAWLESHQSPTEAPEHAQGDGAARPLLPSVVAPTPPPAPPF